MPHRNRSSRSRAQDLLVGLLLILTGIGFFAGYFYVGGSCTPPEVRDESCR